MISTDSDNKANVYPLWRKNRNSNSGLEKSHS